MASPLSRVLPAAACAALIAVASTGFAGPTDDTTPVPSANPRSAGTNAANFLTPRLLGRPVLQAVVAEGAMPVENPLSTVGGILVTNYGYYANGPQVPLLTGATPLAEATKSEPDKNTYLVLCGQHGPDRSYDYGTHFLFQGHEIGPRDPVLGARGYVTRVNLDADKDHRVTLLVTQDKAGNTLPAFDGSTWDPFAKVLLLTGETLVLAADGTALSGGMWTVGADWPSTATDITGIVGRGGYEGVQCDSDGNLWIVEDIGGKNGSGTGVTATHAKQPNSFVYRFVPKNPYDLSLGGRLQVLQVASKANPGNPIVFLPGTTDADILTQDMKDLHTYGNTFATKWITIHDTAVDGTTPFNANALAKAKKGTPFKRPENGVFRPGNGFRDFVFTETGDTNLLTEAGAAYGGFGGLFTLSQKKPSDDTGTLRLFFRGDVVHTGFDNITFLTADLVLSAEDAGDTLHGQRNALDSLWMFDADQDFGAATGPAPVRVMAEGRDAPATLDTILGPLTSGFLNDGDNEITGIHVSDGDPTVKGLFGVNKPRPFRDGWRFFWTQQHGTNTTWEVVEPKDHDRDDGCGCDRDSRRDDDKPKDGKRDDRD